MDGADQVKVDDSKVESSEAGISESIAEDIIEDATTDQKIESDLNYSDDFTSSSTSLSSSALTDQNVIKTTLLAKQKLPLAAEPSITAPGDIKSLDVPLLKSNEKLVQGPML